MPSFARLLEAEYFGRSPDFVPVSMALLEEVIAFRESISDDLNLDSSERDVLESFLAIGAFPSHLREKHRSISQFLSIICVNCGECCRFFSVDENGIGIPEQIPGGTGPNPNFRSPCLWLTIDEEKRDYCCSRYDQPRPSLCVDFQCPWAFTLGIASGHNLRWDIPTWWDRFCPDKQE